LGTGSYICYDGNLSYISSYELLYHLHFLSCGAVLISVNASAIETLKLSLRTVLGEQIETFTLLRKMGTG